MSYNSNIPTLAIIFSNYKVHGWSMWLTIILDLVPSFSKVHVSSLWFAQFALCNVFRPQLFPKVHGWSLWFALCNAFSPQYVRKCKPQGPSVYFKKN
ncbi:hypothetical protein Hanom_Chr16g01417741 [Helianthus anomalus]